MRNISYGKMRACREVQIPVHAPLNVLPETGSKQSKQHVKCKVNLYWATVPQLLCQLSPQDVQW